MTKTGAVSVRQLPHHLIAGWLELGHQALVVGYEPRLPLTECLRACEDLVVMSTLLSHDMNITQTAGALNIGRKRVRMVLQRWKELGSSMNSSSST